MEFLLSIIPELSKSDMVDSEQNVKAVNLRQVFKKLIGRRSYNIENFCLFHSIFANHSKKAR
jgi:hypothetical protein